MVGEMAQPERGARQSRVNAPHRKPWPLGSSTGGGGGVWAVKFGKGVGQVRVAFPARQSSKALCPSETRAELLSVTETEREYLALTEPSS